jgi:hypothetical protein
MAFFIEISGKSYKVPNKVIIGRGEPFTQLNANRNVARAHLSLLFEDGRWFIKNLVHRELTTMYGKPLLTGKYYEIYPEDEVEFGGELIKVPAADPEDYIEVKKNLVTPVKELSAQTLIYSSYALTVLCMTFLSLEEFNFFTFFSHLFMLALVLFLPLALALRYWNRNIMANEVRYVYFGEEGFTIHYADKKNQTFKLNEVETWSSMNKARTVFVRAYGSDYRLEFGNSIEGFQKYLKENLPEQENSEIFTRQGLFGWTVFGLLLIIVSNWGLNHHIALMVLYCLLALTSIGMILNRQVRQFWFIPVNQYVNPEAQRNSLIITCLIALWLCHSSWQDQQYLKLNQRLVRACSLGSGRACQQVDVVFLKQQRLRISRAILQSACEEKNPHACHLLSAKQSERRPAGRK